jgi:CubicO group peptidase (beta-lactamase class C family)
MEAALPMTVDTVLPVASVTKSFTALAIMQLQDRGRLSVHDPVVTYLPEFRVPNPPSTSPITLHHLLTHTAGLPPMLTRWFVFARDARRDMAPGEIPVALNGRPPIDTYEQLIAYLAESRWTPLGAPGAYMSYSNEGYVLLGAVVERVSGEPYSAYVRSHILAPLGLQHTGFDVEMPDGGEETATLYVARTTAGGDQIVRMPGWWSSGVWLPTGGLCSSVSDLIRYLDAYRQGGRGVVSPGAVTEMLHAHTRSFPAGGYGYGWEVVTDNAGTALVTHDGGRRGVSANVLFDPRHAIVAAAVANTQGVPLWTITEGARRLMLGIGADRLPSGLPEYTPAKTRLRAYIGEYRSGDGRTISVTARNGDLSLRIDGQPHRVRAAADSLFAVSDGHGGEVYLRFLMGPSGPAWGVTHSLVIFRRARDPMLLKGRKAVRSLLGRAWRIARPALTGRADHARPRGRG